MVDGSAYKMDIAVTVKDPCVEDDGLMYDWTGTDTGPFVVWNYA